MTTYHRNRRLLGSQLRAARQESGVSGNQFAARLGWPQSKVSRIETGAQMPTKADVAAWCAELTLPRARRDTLADLLHQAAIEHRSWKENYALAGGAAGKQQEILALEARAASIRMFQPNIIPGLLQTPMYATQMLQLLFGPRRFGVTDDDIRQLVLTRSQRQRALYDPHKTVRCIVLENALVTRVCSVDTLTEQLIRLVELTGLPTASLGIVPNGEDLPIIPLGGYSVFDEDMVLLETLSGEQQLSSPDDVSQYIASFEALAKVAVWGSGAASLLRSTLESVRNTYQVSAK